jgi:hypothetical protein
MSILKLKDELDNNEKLIIADISSIQQFSKAKKKDRKSKENLDLDIPDLTKREKEITDIADKIDNNHNYHKKLKHILLLQQRLKSLHLVNEISLSYTGLHNKVNLLKEKFDRDEADMLASIYMTKKPKEKKKQKYITINDYDSDESIDIGSVPIVISF